MSHLCTLWSFFIPSTYFIRLTHNYYTSMFTCAITPLHIYMGEAAYVNTVYLVYYNLYSYFSVYFFDYLMFLLLKFLHFPTLVSIKVLSWLHREPSSWRFGSAHPEHLAPQHPPAHIIHHDVQPSPKPGALTQPPRQPAVHSCTDTVMTTCLQPSNPVKPHRYSKKRETDR